MPNRAFPLEDLALVELTGDDRFEWLQGQATNDVRKLERDGRCAFCFCEPTGQILAILEAWTEGDRIVMAVDRQRVQAVLDRIETMTILEDVVARELPLRGAWVELAADRPDRSLTLPWRLSGCQVWASPPEVERVLASREVVDPEPLRIAAGIPKWGVDAGPRTLPPELGPAFEASHVSYSKGCYTGQEILMRMHSRGHANRTWVGLVSDTRLTPGESVVFEEKEVGRVTSAAGRLLELQAFVAAAMVRNAASVDGSSVRIGGAVAEVRTLPLWEPI